MTRDKSSFQKLDTLSRRRFIAGVVASVVAVGGVLPVGMAKGIAAYTPPEEYFMPVAYTTVDRAGRLIRGVIEISLGPGTRKEPSIVRAIEIPPDDGEYLEDDALFDDDDDDPTAWESRAEQLERSPARHRVADATFGLTVTP